MDISDALDQEVGKVVALLPDGTEYRQVLLNPQPGERHVTPDARTWVAVREEVVDGKVVQTPFTIHWKGPLQPTEGSEIDEHVERFLSPLTPRSTFLSLATTIVDRAAHDSEVATFVNRVGAHLASTLVDSSSIDQFRSLLSPGALPDLEGIPPGATTLAAVSYLKMTEYIRSSTVPPLTTLTAALSNPQLLRTIQPEKSASGEFLSRLLVETGRRAAEDSSFETRLNTAASDLQSMMQRFDELSSRLQSVPSPATATASASASARARTICRINNRPVPCWLYGAVVVTVIVLVVVAK